jgi:hypothetical protein
MALVVYEEYMHNSMFEHTCKALQPYQVACQVTWQGANAHLQYLCQMA